MAAKVNWPVAAALLLCYIIAFGLAVAAEEHRSQAVVTFVGANDTAGNTTWVFPDLNRTGNPNVTYSGYYYCKYDTDVSSSYGVAGFTFLAITQVVVMGMTKCFCFDGEHKPGGTRTCSLLSFGFLWLCFSIAEICFLAGANKNALRSRTREFVTGNDKIDKYLTCENMHRGIFGAAAAFTFFSMMAGECYYVCLVLCRSVIDSNWQGRDGQNSNSSSSMGLNRPIPNPYALGSDDTGTARTLSMQNLNLSGQGSDFYGTNRPMGNMNRPQTQMARNPMPSPYALG